MRNNKTYILALVLLLASLHCVGQQTFYVINSVVPSPITIGEREVKKSDTVSGNDIVKFSCTDQKIRVQAIRIDMDPILFYSRLDGKTLDYGMLHKNEMTKAWEEGKGLITKGIEGEMGYLFFNGLKDPTRFIPEKRLAIVIGNNSYYNGLSNFRQWWNDVFRIPNNKPATLTKPRIDADNMQNKLVHMGFDVMEVRDATKNEMKKAFNEFFKKAKNYNLVLIYFSGHGVRYKDDDCMLPVDVKSSNVGAKKSELSIDALLKDFRKLPSNSEGRCLIIITDACRTVFGDNKKGEDGELTKTTKLNENELVFQSVSEDEIAFQGADDGNPSPFTEALIKGTGTGNSIFYEFYQIKKNYMYEGSKPSLDGQPGWFDEHSFVKKGKSMSFGTQNNEN